MNCKFIIAKIFPEHFSSFFTSYSFSSPLLFEYSNNYMHTKDEVSSFVVLSFSTHLNTCTHSTSSYNISSFPSPTHLISYQVIRAFCAIFMHLERSFLLLFYKLLILIIMLLFLFSFLHCEIMGI